MTIRAANSRELDAIERLEKACFADAWIRHSLAHALENHVVFVADDGEICGYAIASIVGDEAEILRIAVAPGQRKRGVGANLLTGILAELRIRGALTIFLEVRAGNEAAKRLYETANFEEVGRRPRYYADGEDALIFRLVIRD